MASRTNFDQKVKAHKFKLKWNHVGDSEESDQEALTNSHSLIPESSGSPSHQDELKGFVLVMKESRMISEIRPTGEPSNLDADNTMKTEDGIIFIHGECNHVLDTEELDQEAPQTNCNSPIFESSDSSSYQHDLVMKELKK